MELRFCCDTVLRHTANDGLRPRGHEFRKGGILNKYEEKTIRKEFSTEN